MKKFLLPLLLFIAVVVLIFGYILFIGGKKSGPISNSLPPNNEGVQKENNSKVAFDTYQDYSKEAFEANADKKRVLFFHAPWCPTCRPANAEFLERASEIPDDVIVFKTDYDSQTELKAKYGITYQHTYVLVDNLGNEIKKWNGGAVDQLLIELN